MSGACKNGGAGEGNQADAIAANEIEQILRQPAWPGPGGVGLTSVASMLREVSHGDDDIAAALLDFAAR